MSASSRSNTVAAAPTAKPPTVIHPTATVADKASLTGTHAITIGARAIVHPFARLDSSAGPIDIGEAVNVWEKAVVGAAPVGNDALRDQVAEKTTTIAAHASIHAHATVEASCSIGEHASVEVGATVDAGAVLGEHVKIGTCCVIETGVQLKPFTSVFMMGEKQMQRVNSTMKDNEELRDLYEKGRDRETVLLKRLVKANNMKWAT